MSMLRVAVLSALLVPALATSGMAWLHDPCWPKDFIFGHPFPPIWEIGYVVGAPTSSTVWPSAEASGTSGCGGAAEVSLRQFLRDADEPLQADLARGSGAYVYAVAELLGCPPDAVRPFGAAAQAVYPRLAAAAAAPAALERELARVVRDDPRLTARCGPASTG